MKKHYENLYQDSIKKIYKEQYIIDKQIRSPEDNRFGITLLLRPSPKVKNNISAFLKKMKEIDPGQYYYPESDMHITVLSIVSCYSGFDIGTLKVSEYIQSLNKIMTGTNNFLISLKGITASPSCIMLRGFPENDSLNILRNKIRSGFKKNCLFNTIDTRYKLKTAHSTIIRFQEKLADKENFLKILNKFKDFDFGSFEVSEIELVYNDWYQRKKNTEKLAIFNLDSGSSQ